MSSARSRQQKRKSSRPPGVWVGDRSRRTSLPPVERTEHGVRDEVTVSWRMFSGGIVACLLLVLVVFFATDLFFVRGISLEGAEYLNEAEVFRYAGIAEDHVFWVNPEAVRQNIMDATPLVADAQVSVGWPPNMVTIIIQERKPSLLWTQAGVRVLIDVHGNVLRSPRDEETFPDLIQVVADESFDSPRIPSEPVPADVVRGALQLQQIVSGLPSLRYNAQKGLGFREPNAAWDVWLGAGTDMPNKLKVYEALRDDLMARGVTPVEINVANLAAVYYCGSVEFCYE